MKAELLLVMLTLTGCNWIANPISAGIGAKAGGFSVSSSVTDSTIILGVEGSGTVQAMIDSDMNPSTGYAGGFDYVVRGVETEGDRAPIRSTNMDASNPGGWGPIVGWARIKANLSGYRIFSIPRKPLGAKRIVRYRVELDGAEGYQYRDGVTR